MDLISLIGTHRASDGVKLTSAYPQALGIILAIHNWAVLNRSELRG